MTASSLIHTTSIYFDPAGSWLGIVLLVAAFVCLLFFLAPDKSRLSPRRRLALIALRTAALLVLVFCMSKPSMVSIRQLQQPATVLVLADSSESMNVADSPNSKTRWEYLRQTLKTAMESTRKQIVSESMLVRAWVFDREARQISIDNTSLDIGAWERRPSSEETAIGSAMESAVRAMG